MEYKPLKVLRRLLDYYLRRKVIEEFKSKQVKSVNWFNIVLIELKRKLILKRYSYSGLSDTPKYDGKMYKYDYVMPSHKKIRYYFDNPETNKKAYTLFDNMIIEYIKHPVISYCIKTTISDIYNWDINDLSDTTINQIKDILKTKKKWTDKTYKEILCNKLYKEKYNIKDVPDYMKSRLIKIRFEIGKMDLKQSPVYYYNPKNLKYWDKKTMKTSNKGLKADTTYSWSDDYSRGGWTFGGISADDLERICVINGFKIEKEIRIKNEKEKLKNKKYKYGEFANWFLHTLI